MKRYVSNFYPNLAYIVGFYFVLPKDKKARERRALETIAALSSLDGFTDAYCSLLNFVAAFDSKEAAIKGIEFLRNWKYTKCIDDSPLLVMKGENKNGRNCKDAR